MKEARYFSMGLLGAILLIRISLVVDVNKIYVNARIFEFLSRPANIKISTKYKLFMSEISPNKTTNGWIKINIFGFYG